MPRIETLSSGVGQIETRATASALFDKTGIDSLSAGLGEISDTFKKMEIDEQQIQAARVLSEARQQWMLDFDKRKTEAETNGTYQGFTQSFQKDYRAWMPNAVKGIRNKDVAAKLELSLMDLETSFLGDAISYESSQRGKILKENYAQAIALPKVQIDAARTPEEVDDAYFQAQGVIDMLPDGELKKEGLADINAVKLNKQAEMVLLRVDDYDKVLNEIDQNEFVTGDQKKALGFNLNQAREAGYSKIVSNTNEELAFLEKKAEAGALEGDYASPLLSEIDKLPDDMPEKKEVVDRILSIKNLNKNIKLMADMNDAEYSQLEESMANSGNPNDYENVYNLALAREKYKENLSKDFAGTVMVQTPMARKAYENYSKSLADNSDVGVKNQKQAFDVYASYLETKADKLGISRTNINLMPEKELQSLVGDIESSYDKRDGYLQVSQKMTQLQETYGPRFKSVMRELSNKSPELGALSIIPRIQDNLGRNVQQVKNDIIRAITLPKVDKEIYGKILPADVTIFYENSTYKDISNEFTQSNMADEKKYREFAYENLAKMYMVRDGKSASKAAEEAAKVVYGDVDVFKNIVFPVSKKNTIDQIYMGGMSALKISPYIQPLDESKKFEIDMIKESPEDYIEFVASKDGDGIMPVWLNTLQQDPVKDSRTGQPFVFKWNDAELAGKNIPIPRKRPKTPLESTIDYMMKE